MVPGSRSSGRGREGTTPTSQGVTPLSPGVAACGCGLMAPGRTERPAEPPLTGRAGRRKDMRPGSTMPPITPESLAELVERHGERWNIRPSAHGRYALATLRRG